MGRAIQPQALWTLVVLIAALSLVGYVATRMLGPSRGTAVTGLTGGLVSSTAVTLSFAKRSREEGGGSVNALAAGLLLAWTVMSVRVVVLVSVVYAPLVRPLLVPFAAMTAATLVPVALLLRRKGADPAEGARHVELRNPFSLTSAVKFGLLFAAVLLVVAGVRRYFPGEGYYVVAALAGLTDVDAITLSMASRRDGGTDVATAAGAIVVAALANTLVKCGIIVGTAAVALRRRVVVVTLLVLAAGLGALWLL